MNTDQVRAILAQYPTLLSLQGTYNAIFPYEKGGLAGNAVTRKIDMIHSWLHQLREAERFVVTRHLFEKQPWPQIEKAYEERFGIRDGRAERTLKRYQKTALKRIATFIEHNGFEASVLSLFRTELQMARFWHGNGTVLSLHEHREII